MALTNFAALTSEQLTVWERDVWRHARNMAFIGKFTGTSEDSMIQRITALTKTEKGARAVITLVADLEGDGVAGDRTLEGNEEGMKSYDQVIRIDQLRHANRHEGRMADQKSVVRFRENSKNVLGYWLSDRWDQMAFLTLSGVSYSLKTDGSLRVGSDLPNLEFAADVTAPTANRHFNWDASAGALVAGNTATIEAGDTPSYKMLVKVRAKLTNNFVRPIRGEGGTALYHVFMCPDGIAALKLDQDFIDAVKNSRERGESNPFWKGFPNGIYVDGFLIHEFRHVYNTLGAASGSKWGAGSAIDGQRVLFCGAQALGMADIGRPLWVEKEFDYNNQPGISVAKIAGFKKPVFRAVNTATNEDFGVICVNTAI
jgi:N4-gp56 family major capsid protein